jgi:hypothetical protein
MLTDTNIFSYKERLNDCQFEGIVESKPVTDYYIDPKTQQQVYRINFLIRQKDLLIPCIAYGRSAIKIENMIEQSDVIFVRCTFRPNRIQDKILFRFFVHYLVVLTKANDPSSLRSVTDKDNDLDEEQLNKILADVLA